MKKYILLLILLLLKLSVLYSAENFWTRYTHLYLYDYTGFLYEVEKEPVLYTDEPKEEKSLLDETRTGFKLNIPFMEIHAFGKYSGELSFAKNVDLWKNCENINYGVSIFSDKYFPAFPCITKIGNLSPGGTISKISNPLISNSLSPFSSPNTNVSCINASLPGSNTFSKPESFFLQCQFNNSKAILTSGKFNTWYSPSQDISSISGSVKIQPVKNLKLEFSGTTAYFPFEEHNNNSWFTTRNFYYHQGIKLCSNLQTNLISPYFQTLNNLFLYQSPFNQTLWVIKNDSKIKTKGIILYISSLYCKDEIITSSSKTIEPVFQLKTGLSNLYTLPFLIPVFLKTGSAVYLNSQLTENSKDVNFSIGMQLTCLLFSLSLESVTKSILENSVNQINFSYEGFSFHIKNQWSIKFFSPVFEYQYNQSLDSDNFITETNKISVNLFVCTNPKISSTNFLSLTSKNQEITKWKEKSSVNFTYSSKFVTYNINLAIVFNRG